MSSNDQLIARLEGLKWAALSCMVIDHLGKTVAPQLLIPTHMIGRMALPWFVLIVALRLAHAPQKAAGYLPRLLLWGALAQPAFAWMNDTTTLNVMFTLALGVAVVWASQRLHARRDRHLTCTALGVTLGVAASYVEFGPVGALMLPLLVIIARRSRWWAALSCGVFAVFANLLPIEQAHMASLTALLAGPLAFVQLRWGVKLSWRPHKVSFYLFYATHLWLLWCYLEYVIAS